MCRGRRRIPSIGRAGRAHELRLHAPPLTTRSRPVDRAETACGGLVASTAGDQRRTWLGGSRHHRGRWEIMTISSTRRSRRRHTGPEIASAAFDYGAMEGRVLDLPPTRGSGRHRARASEDAPLVRAGAGARRGGPKPRVRSRSVEAVRRRGRLQRSGALRIGGQAGEGRRGARSLARRRLVDSRLRVARLSRAWRRRRTVDGGEQSRGAGIRERLH